MKCKCQQCETRGSCFCEYGRKDDFGWLKVFGIVLMILYFGFIVFHK